MPVDRCVFLYQLSTSVPVCIFVSITPGKRGCFYLDRTGD